MQSIAWYVRRLKSMSAAEMIWRIRCKVQAACDRCVARIRRRPVRLARVIKRAGDQDPRVTGLGDQSFAAGGGPPELDRWRADVTTRADRILEHRLTFFDLDDHDLGDPIRWNFEPKARKPTPMNFAPSIDYRDYGTTGDCKLVWEPNRHHQLVVLARAYRLTGDRRYATGVVDQLTSWIQQCPYGYGMNWRSPLELGIRMINWVWALDLIAPADVVSASQRTRIVQCAYRHLWDISRKYSRYSSANNHLIGEAAGVLIGSSCFHRFKQAARWRRESRDILAREIITQTYPDGGTREQAFGYHMFVLQFFLLAGLVARRTGEDFADAYWDRLEAMFAFIAAVCEGGDAMPMVGDGDDGYVLDLGGREDLVRSYLAVGAVLFHRADFKAAAGALSEPAWWLLGEAARERFDALHVDDSASRIESRSLPDTGYYLLQRGRRRGADRISVMFDCGALGFGSIAAHGHADALSVTLRAFGADVLIDTGTYDYFTYGRWRDYFRSTRAHNTVVIDGLDQSENLGAFMWGRKAEAVCIDWRPVVGPAEVDGVTSGARRDGPAHGGGCVVGEHDGYAHLADPVVHRRTVTLAADRPELRVVDDIDTTGRHDVSLHWHCAEQCRVDTLAPNRFEVEFGRGIATIEITRMPRSSGTSPPRCDESSASMHGETRRPVERALLRVPAVSAVGAGGWRPVDGVAVAGPDPSLVGRASTHQDRNAPGTEPSSPRGDRVCPTEPDASRGVPVSRPRPASSPSVPPAFSCSMHRAQAVPIEGWVSRGYHRKAPSTTIVAACTCDGPMSFETRITIRRRPPRADP